MSFTIVMLLASAQVGAFGERERDMQKVSSRAATTELAEYADCIVADRSNAAAVTRFLREFPDDGAKSQAGIAVFGQDCIGRRFVGTMSLSISWASLRGALYPALYRREFGKGGPPAAIAALEPLSLTTEFDRDTATLPADYRPRRFLGDCVARRAPQEAHALLMAKPYSKSENLAVDRLKGTLAICLPKGQVFRLNRDGLRAYIGEAMVKLARAAIAGGGTGAQAASPPQG
ncbi:hypothetical protein [Sphingomonas sp. LT1P40]|uniref:hypothetical protein n=1 Tax=Alteristakelama amylovorans TaxID=3096166 RepID=UPI002FC6FF84